MGEAAEAVLNGPMLLPVPDGPPAGATAARTGQTARVVTGTVLFVAGFAGVFTAYGALFGGLGGVLVEQAAAIMRVLGVVTIVLGLALGGWLPGLDGGRSSGGALCTFAHADHHLGVAREGLQLANRRARFGIRPLGTVDNHRCQTRQAQNQRPDLAKHPRPPVT